MKTKADILDSLDTFTTSYLETALWSSTDDKDEPMDNRFSIDNFTRKALLGAIDDCNGFRELAGELLQGIDVSQAGHDFWLTRNRHGAGFWDRGLGEIGQKLTECAHSYGSCDLMNYKGNVSMG